MGKEIFAFSFRMRELERRADAVTLMIGTPIHTNLGDHLITLAQYKFLEDIGYDNKIVEIPTEMFQVYKKRLAKLNNVKMVLINGGGWLGNLWPIEEKIFQEIVKIFCERKIVVFPQTIYFDWNIKPCDTFIESANTIFKCCKNLTLCVREWNSYIFAKKYYYGIKIMLVPDIAMYYKYFYPEKKGIRRNVGVCLRNDRETVRNNILIERITDIFKNQGYSFQPLDTMNSFRIPTYMREQIVRKRLDLFSQYDYIITDRLHGMIFAFITNTPCVVLDNKTQKVSGVYSQWLKEMDSIFTVFDEDNVQFLLNFIKSNKKGYSIKNLKGEFYELKEIIKNG